MEDAAIHLESVLSLPKASVRCRQRNRQVLESKIEPLHQNRRQPYGPNMKLESPGLDSA